MNFKKSGRFFFGKSCSRNFGAPGCHPNILIDLVNTSMDSKDSADTMCMISEGYRTHEGVTGPMNFKKRTFFFRKLVLPNFGAPACHPSILIVFVNTALAARDSVETICTIRDGRRTHRGVTGPSNFKKIRSFFRKIVLPQFWAPWLPSKHFN